MRAKPPEKDNSERYLLTYADLMNLLLILFIVLFCKATKDVVKGYKVLNGIAAGFTGTSSVASATASTGGASSGSSKASGKTATTTDYSDFYAQLIGLLEKRGILNKVDITAKNNEVVITLKDTVLFAPGKADLDSDATSLLHTIGGLMTKISFGSIFVEGNTDSDPIHNSEFRDNWELSNKRALNVSEILKSAGVDPAKVFPVGFGEYHPVANNDTTANKAKNRRVVIAIVRKGLTPSDESASASELQQILKEANADSVASGSSKSSTSKKTTGETSAKTSTNKASTGKTSK